MKFCTKCGSMLRPKDIDGKRYLACSCGYVDDTSTNILRFNEKKQAHDISVAEKSDAPHVIVQESCPKCDNNEAEHWTQQVGPSDEPEANIFKCTKCGYSWRDSHHY